MIRQFLLLALRSSVAYRVTHADLPCQAPATSRVTRPLPRPAHA